MTVHAPTQIIWLHVVHGLIVKLHVADLLARHLVLLPTHRLCIPHISLHHTRLESVKLLLRIEELMLARLRVVDHAPLKIHSLLELLLRELVPGDVITAGVSGLSKIKTTIV